MLLQEVADPGAAAAGGGGGQQAESMEVSLDEDCRQDEKCFTRTLYGERVQGRYWGGGSEGPASAKRSWPRSVAPLQSPSRGSGLILVLAWKVAAARTRRGMCWMHFSSVCVCVNSSMFMQDRESG